MAQEQPGPESTLRQTSAPNTEKSVSRTMSTAFTASRSVSNPEPLSEAMPSARTGAEKRLHKVQAIFAKYDLDLSRDERDVRSKVTCERVNKSIRMRVRYTCHNCHTSFGHDRICVSCQHRRCSHCLRYPPKKDRKKALREQVVQSKPERSLECQDEAVVQICTCHECQTGFEMGVEECPNCHHQVCERCLTEAIVSVGQSPAMSTIPQQPPLLPVQQPIPPKPPSNAIS